MTRYDLADPTLPLAFLPDRLAHASVTLGGVPCRAETPGRFGCGEGDVELARTVRDVGGAPRPCLSISAAAPLDAPVAVTFPPMRVGRTLHGHVGLSEGASLPRSSPAGGAAARGGRADGPTGAAGPPAPVRLAVLLDGEEVGTAEMSGAGWALFRIDMTRSAGQTRAISLVLTTPGRLALCLDALVLP